MIYVRPAIAYRYILTDRVLVHLLHRAYPSMPGIEKLFGMRSKVSFNPGVLKFLFMSRQLAGCTELYRNFHANLIMN